MKDLIEGLQAAGLSPIVIDENTRWPADSGITHTEQLALNALIDRGYAVAIFSPAELGDADPADLEDVMIERGWNFIEWRKSEDRAD